MDSPSNVQSNNMTNSLAKRAALYIGILAFALVLLLFLGVGQASAEDVSTDITVDTTWTSGNTYNITDTVYVASNVTLTIEENVTVIYEYGYSGLGVYGELLVQGSADHPVIFTWNESTMFYGLGIGFMDGSTGSVAYANISHMDGGIYLGNASIQISNVTFSDMEDGLYGEFNSYGAIVSLSFQDLSFTTVAYPLYLQNYNGSLGVSLNGCEVNNAYYAISLYAQDFFGTGMVDLSIIDSNFDLIDEQVVNVGAGVVDIHISDTVMNDTYDAIYAHDYENNNLMAIGLENVTLTNVYQLINAYNENGSIEITMDGVTADEFGYGVYGDAYDGAVNLNVMNSMFSNVWYEGAVFYLESYQGDSTVALQDSTFDGVSGVLEVYAYNGSIDATLDGLTTNNTYFVIILEAEDFFGTGTVDLAITGSWFNNSYGGLQVEAEMIGAVSVTDTEITDIYGMIFMAEDVLEVPTGFLSVVPVGLIFYAESGDLVVALDNVTFEWVPICVIALVENGSASLTMTDVVSNNSMLVAGVMARDYYRTGTVDATITDCSFNNTETGVMMEADLIGTVTVTNTFAAGAHISSTLQPGTAFDIIGHEEGTLTTVVFDHVTAESFGTVFYVEVYNDLDLTIDSVVTNDTGTVGYFEALNLGQNATMNIVVVNSSFSNTTDGLVFITNILDPDFSLLGTNTFTNIFGQSLIMQADLGDVVLNFEQFVMTDGGGISVHLGFGNIEVNIIDSVLDCSGYGTILDLIVNSDTLDNGFITLNVVNSTLSDADNGIRTWSEELVVMAMQDATFVNITGIALYFDVRSTTSTAGVLTLALDNFVGDNVGGGLFVYLNDGNLDLTISNSNLMTTYPWSQFGVMVEVSSVLPDDLSVIDLVVTDSVFEGGIYGIYATSINGGTAVITGSQFLGHSGVGYWFDSLYGEMDVEITDSIFDGSSAADMNSYLVAEAENTFQLIGWTYWTPGVDSWTSGDHVIDLPFAFTYMGSEYTTVTLSEEGRLIFGGNDEIRPVGATNLLYYYKQFFGYKVAEDNMSVMFHWYASEVPYGSSLSSTFQVVLFADGTIQFNYADMEAYATTGLDYGLVDNGATVLNLRTMTGLQKYEADWMSYMFTPLSISYGMGALLTMDEGNITATITNNTVSGYYNGGIAVLSLDGNLNLEVTGNAFSNIVGDDYSALYIYCFNGATDLVMADNTFDRIWGLAIYLTLSSTEGGEKSVDMSDSVFNDVRYVLYSVISVYDDTGRTGNDSLDVTVNFQNNIMTNAYGLYCDINLYLYDPVDWTVTVVQTMTDNTMVEEEGLRFLPWLGWIPSDVALGSSVNIEQENEDQNSVTLEQTATVTGNHIEFPGDYGIWVGNVIYNDYGDTTRSAAIEVTNNQLIVSGDEGISVWSEMYMGVGNVVDDTSIIIEDNEIIDGYQNIDAIDVYVTVDSYYGTDFDQSGDADITIYVSVSNNLVEGAYDGVYSGIDIYQDNLVGDWYVALTHHVDGNQLLNVSYAVYAYMYAGPYFSNAYWPPENETAVANFVMDYLYTVDNNLITGQPGYSWDMVYVDIEYRAWIETGTVSIAAESYAWITGAISISGNDITVDDEDGIYLYHWLGAQKSSWIWVDVDVAVDNNVLTLFDEDSYGEDAIYLDSYTEVQCNDQVITPVGATVDMSWSVTGNQINGFENGIEVYEEIDLDGGMSCIDYNVEWDISGNTLTDMGNEGISYELYRADYDTYGTIEMNIAVDINDNIISMEDIDDSNSGIYLDSCENTSRWEYWDEQYGNHTFVASVSGNTVSGAYYGLEIYGTLYWGVPTDYELTGDEVLYTYVNDIVVENNYVSDSWYGMYLEDAMDVRNNIVECDIGADYYGIFWYEAEGEMVGNTITAEYAVEIEYLHHLLVQGNLLQFGANGMYIYYYNDEEDADGAIIDNTITALENPFLPWSSYGIELYYVPNVLIANNVISGADYGVNMEEAWNITVEGNEISDANEAGIYVDETRSVWIESNTVSGCNYGLYIYSDVEDLVVGNNTFVANYYGIYMSTEVHRMVLWNNVFIDNEYGVEIYSYLYMEVVWYVDAQCQSSRSDIYINAPIYILAGGSMVVEDTWIEIQGGLTVDEGGLLSLSDVYVEECWFIDVAGTFWASLSVFDETDVNLGPTAEAEIRTSTFYYTELVIDGCPAVIADNLFVGYSDEYGVVVKNGATPSIVSNIIALYAVGIYANGMDMGGIYDNLIVANSMAGLLAENCTGAIHDNIFLLNKVEVLLRNSDVSVEDNEIGYTNMFQVIANYAPILGHFVNLTGEGGIEATIEDPQAAMDSILASSWSDIGSWVKAHNGIWSEGSTVRTSGNVYGLVNYALYAVDSEIHFADDVRTIVLNVPHANEGEMYNYSLNIYTLNGLYAARSQVWVDGSTIEVLDDALVLESSEAWVEGATLLAGDFDYFVFGGSNVYNIATNYSKAKVMDSHSLNEGTWLTISFLDEGDPAVNISVLIKNAKGEIVYNGTTDADGKVKILLTQHSYTSEGKDDGFNPYTITADFESGEKSTDVVLDQSYQDLTIEGEEESDIGAILAVVGVLVIILLIVAAVVVMRRRK